MSVCDWYVLSLCYCMNMFACVYQGCGIVDLRLFNCIGSSACWKEISKYLQVCVITHNISHACDALILNGMVVGVQATNTLNTLGVGYEAITLLDLKCLCGGLRVSMITYCKQ